MIPIGPAAYGNVHIGIVELLECARRAAARRVNALMTASYWKIGRRIVEFEQDGTERAAYGEALIQRLAHDLSDRFGRGFSRQNLQQMRAFYLAFPTGAICQTLSGNSSFAPVLPIPPAILAGRTNSESPTGQADLITLAKAFPLPWSSYVRLLSVKNPAASNGTSPQPKTP